MVAVWSILGSSNLELLLRPVLSALTLQDGAACTLSFRASTLTLPPRQRLEVLLSLPYLSSQLLLSLTLCNCFGKCNKFSKSSFAYIQQPHLRHAEGSEVIFPSGPRFFSLEHASQRSSGAA